ncbi:TonB-dependent receptor [Aquimarina aggregata]|uniref:TonB-dependent receptor n=1 Tax=Aquimarina aggregata TaxID=1642818 RepID=A0A162ZLH7_9FLAO|nr:TonB-dependent receptor [Aquimarina aggregata]KZS39887.1 TonB-dependent receptor [Aquimarina aggregata]
MKNAIFYLTCLLLSNYIAAQEFQLSGTVTDQKSQPIPNVTILIKGTSTGTQTNEDGKFSFYLEKETYTLVFSYQGTDRKEVVVDLIKDNELDIQLEEILEKLDEVLVKSVRVEADSPITHSNVSKEEIATRNLGQDIPILLNYLPGVVSTTDAGTGVGYTYIRVRGSDASRVNVTLNGIPFNDAESQGTFWVNLPDFASSVENLQLQRGVGTSTNGSGAFGASLNLLTDAVSETASGEISNSFGSFGTRRHNVKFSTGILNDHIEIAGRLSAIASDGYVDRASSDLKSYFLQGSYIDDTTLIKAVAFGGHEITYQSWFGIDQTTLENDRTFNPAGQYTDADGNTRFYDNEVDNYKQDHYQLHWNQKYTNNWSTNLGLNYTYGRGFFEQFKEDEDFADYDFTPIVIGGETINTTDLIRRRWLDNDFYVINATANYKDNNLDVDFGAFYSFYDGDHFGEVIWAQNAGGSEIRDNYYFGNGKKDEFTIFGKTTYRINDQWSAFLDLQGRFVGYETTGDTSDRVPLEVDEKYDFFNPKLGATFHVNKTNHLYASYARANREPRRSDFENGINTAERLNDIELGWRFTNKKAVINANLYYMWYKDQLVLTGALDDVGAPIRATSGESYRLGIEIDADIALWDRFIIKPNLAISSNKNKDFVTSKDGSLVNLGDTNISYSPNIVLGNMLIYQPIKNLQLGFLSKFVGEQYMGNIDSKASKLDSFFTNDLNIVYEIKNIPVFKSIVLTGLVNNVFDLEYVSNGFFFTFDDDFTNPGTIITREGAGFYPQAGINFLLGATLKF